MICASIKVSLRASVKTQDKIVRYNWQKLLDQNIKLEFDLKLSNRFGVLEDELMRKDIQSGYDTLLKALKETADSTLGTIEKSERKHWVSEATIELISARDDAKLKLEQLLVTKVNSKTLKKAQSAIDHQKAVLKKLSKQFELAHENDHVKYLESQCAAMKLAAENREPRNNGS